MSTLLLEDVSDDLCEAKIALRQAASTLQDAYRYRALLFKVEDLIDAIVKVQSSLPDNEPEGGFERG